MQRYDNITATEAVFHIIQERFQTLTDIHESLVDICETENLEDEMVHHAKYEDDFVEARILFNAVASKYKEEENRRQSQQKKRKKDNRARIKICS